MTTGSSPTQPGSRVGALKYQIAHGFRRGQPVYGAPATGKYTLATEATGFDGVVGSVPSANQFELVIAGQLDNIASTLTMGSSLYLSTVPGVLKATGNTLVYKAQSADKAVVQPAHSGTASTTQTGTVSATGFTSASNTGSGTGIFNPSTSTTSALKFKTVTTSGIATLTDNGSSLDVFVPAPSGSTLPSYKATVLAEAALISYWTFDDAFGSTSFVDSKGGNTLTATAFSGGGSALFSTAGTALIMASGAASAQGGNVGLPVGNSPRSVELWFRTTSTASAGVFHYGTPSFGAQDFSIGINANNTGAVVGLISVSFGTFGPLSSPNVLVFDGLWHQIVVTCDGPATGSVIIYYDGIVVASETGFIMGTIYSNTYPLAIGGSAAFFAGNLIGMIDEVSLYNVALTPTQIARHYYLGRASPTK